jgi:hypothetical protein
MTTPSGRQTADVDLRLRDAPLLNRRPDIAVPPDSVTTDQTDKPAEYAAAGIRHFWRVEDIDDVKRSA